MHSIVDIENGTPKEIAHIVVANLALKQAFTNLTATYDNLMEEFRTALAPTEPVNSWASLLPEGQRLKDQWTNDLEKSMSPSMPFIFHELQQCLELKYSELANEYGS